MEQSLNRFTILKFVWQKTKEERCSVRIKQLKTVVSAIVIKCSIHIALWRTKRRSAKAALGSVKWGRKFFYWVFIDVSLIWMAVK